MQAQVVTPRQARQERPERMAAARVALVPRQQQPTVRRGEAAAAGVPLREMRLATGVIHSSGLLVVGAVAGRQRAMSMLVVRRAQFAATVGRAEGGAVSSGLAGSSGIAAELGRCGSGGGGGGSSATVAGAGGAGGFPGGGGGGGGASINGGTAAAGGAGANGVVIVITDLEGAR